MVKVACVVMMAVGVFAAVSQSFAEVSNVHVASKNTNVHTESSGRTSVAISIGPAAGKVTRNGDTVAYVGSVVVEPGAKADHISVASENTNIRTNNSSGIVGTVYIK